MGDCFLRVEAVNLGNCLYDTNDISTIRGSSFMVLEAVNGIHEQCKGLQKISTGASTGLFKLTGEVAPERVVASVKQWLNTRTDGHATFVVNSLDFASIPFKEGVETLVAENRASQWKQLTVPWGAGWEGGDGSCALNGVLPGLEKEPFPDGLARKVSSSVKYRRKQGQELRNTIYGRLLGCSRESLPAFTRDLEALSTHSDKGNLSGKIAFIYVDGNKFSKIRDENCHNAELLNALDASVQSRFRNSLLRAVIDKLQSDPDSQTPAGELRLETLLWGGDEIEWVVPAWKGWEVLNLFYQFQPAPSFSVEVPGKAAVEIPLTHAAGIVFCHHNAPILQIRRIARELAEQAKATLPSEPPTRAEGNVFRYLVLESFDMIEGSLGRFLAKYYSPVDHSRTLLMKGEDMTGFAEGLRFLRSVFPRGKVYEIIHAIKDGRADQIQAIFASAVSGFSDSLKLQISDKVGTLTGTDAGRWFSIADLWDFM